MTPSNVMEQIDRADAIHLMAGAIVNLESKLARFERFMKQSEARFEIIEGALPE